MKGTAFPQYFLFCRYKLNSIHFSSSNTFLLLCHYTDPLICRCSLENRVKSKADVFEIKSICNQFKNTNKCRHLTRKMSDLESSDCSRSCSLLSAYLKQRSLPPALPNPHYMLTNIIILAVIFTLYTGTNKEV